MTTTPPAPTLVAHTDADPCPRVEITVTPMPVDADTITVWRSWAGRRTQVRDAVGVTVSGDYFVVDYEAPFGVPVTYTCETADAAGVPSELSAGTSATVAVTEIWMQDPLDPASAIEVATTGSSAGVRALADSFTGHTAEMPAETVTVIGSGEPIALGGTRQAPSQVPLKVKARTVADAEAVRNLWNQAFPLCVRTPTKMPFYRGLAYMVFDYTETPHPDWVQVTFAATARVVRGPGRGVVVQPRTYDHLLDEAATYAGLLPLYPTYLDMRRGS